MGPDNIFVYKFSGDPSSSRAAERDEAARHQAEYAEEIKRFSGSVEDTCLTLYIRRW